MEFLEALARATVSVDEAHGRVYGWLPGIVTDVDTKLMRVKARVGKQGDNESTDWLVPMGMGSVESLPEVGDPVAVDFADGDVHRGRYSYFPQSTTKNRPTHPVPLGDSLVGMYNFAMTQINQLRTDLQTLVTAYLAHKHTGVTTGPGTSAVSDTPVFAANIPPGTINGQNVQKGKASDGSTVADKSTSEIVLSKRTLVR